MPEGDVVRRTAVRLGQALAGRELVHAELRWAALGGVDLAGRTVTEVDAYGKHLLIRIGPASWAAPVAQPALRSDAGDTPHPEGDVIPGFSAIPTAPAEPLTLHSHLKMDGRWLVHATGSVPARDMRDHRTRVVLANAEWTAVGTLIGALDLVPTRGEHKLLSHLGPDIMADDFPTVGLPIAVAALKADPSRHIGAALIDQSVVAGIGTIFMAESLFRQRTSPWSAAGEVDAAALLSVARRLLLRSAQTGSPRDHTVWDGGGTYVHGRSRRPCRRCGDTVSVAPVGGPPFERPAFYCPTCQSGPGPVE